MPDDFYEQMDRAGILVDGGFQCCDAWQLQDSGLTSHHDFAVLQLSALTIGQNLRNHPSVLNFSWSDNNPTRRQEAVSLQGFQQADFQDPLIASAEYKTAVRSSVRRARRRGRTTGCRRATGTTPRTTTRATPSRTNVGGAWAFDSEASAGHTVPTLDSIKRFLSPFEQDRAVAEPGLQPVPRQLRARPAGTGQRRLLVRHAARPRRRDRQHATARGRASTSTSRRPRSRTTRPSAPSSRPTSTTRPTKAALDGHRLLAAQQGLADAAVGPLQQRLRPGRQLLRRQEGQRAAARAVHVRRRVGVGRQPRHAPPGTGCRSSPRCTASTASCSTHQTTVGISVGGQGVARERPASRRSRHDQPADAGEDLLRRAAAQPPRPGRRPQRVLALDPAGRGRLGQDDRQPAGDDDAVREPQPAAVARRRPPCGYRAHQSTVGRHRGRHRDRRARSPTPRPSRRSRSSCAPTSGAAIGSATPASGDNEVLPIIWSDNDVTLWPGESETLRATYRRADLRGAAPVVSVSGWNSPLRDLPAS